MHCYKFTGLMLPEFILLKRAANIAWPTNRPTYLLRPEYEDIIYFNDALPYGLALRIDQSSILPRILLKVHHLNKHKVELPDVVNIWIEPGYRVVKNGRVVWEGKSAEEMVSFVIEGVKKRVKKLAFSLDRIPENEVLRK